MFYNTQHNIEQSRTWDIFNSDVNLLPNIDTSQHARLESSALSYFQGNQGVPTVEKASIMKIAIEQSHISPAGSLDSVGSLPISSLDNSNGESIDDSEASCLR